MSVTQQHSMASSNSPEWIQSHPMLILSLTFVVGLLLGISGNTLMTQQGSIKELAAIRAELHKSSRTINRLAGYDTTVGKANTLLGSLRNQQRSLAVAAEDLRQIDDLSRRLQIIEGDLETTSDRAFKLASTVSTINEQTDLVTDYAESALTSLQDLQMVAIDQQFAIPEVQNALVAQETINEQLKQLGDRQDISERSLEAIAGNQNRIQDLAIGFEESFANIEQIDELMGRQDELELAMRDFDYVLNSAKWLAADAREVQDILSNNRAAHREALANLDQLVWMSDYLGMQGDSLAEAEKSLSKIDRIQDESNRLESALGELVDVVELVSGVNTALASVSDTAVQIRQDLAEIVLLQPAVRQIYSGMHNEVRETSSPRVVDAKERARALIHSSRIQEPEQSHQEILTSH
jgi:vacuolar-type H+-ATPase subunit I/STV1